MSAAGRLGIGLAVLTALGLVVFGVVAAIRAGHPSQTAGVATPQIVSMADDGRAMQQAAAAMQVHGQAILDEGQRTGDQDLIGHGQRWLRDAADLNQTGGWMIADPASSLVDPAGISTADRARLNQAVQNMVHDPTKVGSSVDIQTLSWNGQSMRDEGKNMVDHAQNMAEEIQLMVERYGLQAQAATDLRAGAEALRRAGNHLMQNGQAMMDYADRLRRSMGLK